MAENPQQPEGESRPGPAPQSTPPDADAADVERALDHAQESLDQVQRAVEEQGGEHGGGQGSAAGHADDDDQSTWMPQANARNSDGTPAGIELLGDVDLDVTIELGRTEMVVEDVLRLGSGSVVELDKLAGDPVDVHVNGRLVARGEVLVLNDNFCIRINEIVANLEEEAEAAAHRAAG